MQAIRQQCLRSITYLLTAGLLLTLGCGKNPAGPMTLIPFETIYIGAVTPYPCPLGCGPFQGAIRDATSWQAFWGNYFNSPPPAVDFSHQMVLAIVTPVTACDKGVEILAVEEGEGRRRVQAVFWEAPPGTVCIALAVPPEAHIIKVAWSELPVEFIVTRRTRS